MAIDLTQEDLKQVIRAARIHCPGFTEGQYQALMEMEKRLADSGWLQAVNDLARLMEERGVTSSQALDEYQALLKQKAQLQRLVADVEARVQSLTTSVQHKVQEEDRLEEAIRQAKEGLAGVTAERQRQEQQLASHASAAEKERHRIDRDLDRCRQQAGVTKQEVDAAGKLKELLAGQGFSIDLALSLCRELAGHEDARADLVKAIEEHGTLTKSNADLTERGATEKKALESEIEKLLKQRDEREASLNRLKEERAGHESRLLQLKADIAEQAELRRFYRRYQPVSKLLDKIASWPNVYFYRCNGPVCAMFHTYDSRLLSRVWTDMPTRRCPHCGGLNLVLDPEVYQALNVPFTVNRLVLED